MTSWDQGQGLCLSVRPVHSTTGCRCLHALSETGELDSQADGGLVKLINSFSLSLFFFFGCEACGILVPRPGTESMPPGAEAWNPNHWNTKEFPWSNEFFT